MSDFIRRATLRSVSAAVIVAGTAHAQNRAGPIMAGYFLSRPAVSIGVARRRCLDLGDDTYDADVRQLGQCTGPGFTSLGAAGGDRWYSSLVGRRWLLRDSVKAAVDTAGESELVLFVSDAAQDRRDTLVSPVWHYRFEPEMYRSVTPEIVSMRDGTVLVGIDQCFNGTGGCAQDFFVRRGGSWQVVHPAFLDSLRRRFPDAINHGFHVDLKTLRADAAVYSPTDANCCPSRSAEMRLRLRKDALEIVELRLRPTDGGGASR